MKQGKIVSEDGNQEWYQNGLRHRIDGPAYIGVNGNQSWWQNNQLHRIDGPAYIRSDGTQAWWQNNQLHRLDGPAYIRTDGSQEWYIKGRRIYLNEWKELHSITTDWTDWDMETKILFRMRFAAG